MANYICRADKFFHAAHEVLEQCHAHISNEQIYRALKQCDCQQIKGPGNWFHISDPSKLTYCVCGIATSHPNRRIEMSTHKVTGCSHYNLLYHRQGCSLETYTWPDNHCRNFKPAYQDYTISNNFAATQKLYEEVRPGFLTHQQVLEIIDIFYILMLNEIDCAFPDKYTFIKPAIKFMNIPLAEIANLKIKMRAFGYDDADINKLCEHY